MVSRDLPIFGIESEIISNIRKTRRLVVTAPTGSGKSTQIPQMLLDHGLCGEGDIVILQPRRLAARLLAARVARERNTALGDEVGYQIQFDKCASPRTRIRFITEGILLTRLQNDPRLEGTTVVIFDEFHERHLFSDVTLARVLLLQQSVRPELMLLVMSATLDTAPLEKYLAPCAILRATGQTHPVEIRYLSRPSSPRMVEREPPVWTLAARAFERAVAEGAQGDALIFMPGSYEIAQTLRELDHIPAARGWIRLPLHGELPNAAQDAAVSKYDQPKIVVATNVAESSLTIEGIRLVIDSGLARVPRFDPHRGINTLYIEKISRASADQRAGRAGRTAPGLCLRLWDERDQAARPLYDEPEIKRLDLAEIMLLLKSSGVKDLQAFPWFEPPPPRFIERAETLLRDLGAIDDRGELTDLGRRMAAFPLHPRYSRLLLAAAEYRCVRAAAAIAALTQGRPILTRSAAAEIRETREMFLGDAAASDFFLLIRAWRYAENAGFDTAKCRRMGIHAAAAHQVLPLYRYFLNLAERQGLPIEENPPEEESIQKCILAAFADQLACREDQGTLRCRLIHGGRGEIARSSVAQKYSLVVASEISEIESPRGDLTVLLTQVTAVRPEWLRELYPNDFSEEVVVEFDPAAKKVVARKETRFRDLTLERRTLPEPPPQAAARLLAEEILSGRLALKHWDHAVEQWILRINTLARWCPELGFTPFDETARRQVIENLCQGAVSYKDIKDRTVWPALRAWLAPEQALHLEQHAPHRVVLSNGRSARVTYFADRPPQIALRIQELFGVNSVPVIAMGRIPLVVQILAPNQRPVQVTQDLSNFWKEHYPRIKQELQRKYPKHEWR